VVLNSAVVCAARRVRTSDTPHKIRHANASIQVRARTCQWFECSRDLSEALEHRATAEARSPAFGKPGAISSGARHSSPARVEVSETGLLLLSDYSDEQEPEADRLAGALLLPREGLIQLRSARHSTSEIANRYGVSEALCEWRLRMTGVDVQMQRAYR
jgi:hypothetical protein